FLVTENLKIRAINSMIRLAIPESIFSEISKLRKIFKFTVIVIENENISLENFLVEIRDLNITLNYFQEINKDNFLTLLTAIIKKKKSAESNYVSHRPGNELNDLLCQFVSSAIEFLKMPIRLIGDSILKDANSFLKDSIRFHRCSILKEAISFLEDAILDWKQGLKDSDLLICDQIRNSIKNTTKEKVDWNDLKEKYLSQQDKENFIKKFQEDWLIKRDSTVAKNQKCSVDVVVLERTNYQRFNELHETIGKKILLLPMPTSFFTAHDKGSKIHSDELPTQLQKLQYSSNVVDQYEICRFYNSESVIVPDGLRKNYPKDIDFDQLPNRNNRARNPIVVMGRFQTFLPGYYGSRGASVIFKTLISLFIDLKKLSSDMTFPQKPLDYLTEVLVPETAIRLIADDRNITLDEAAKVMADSVDFGLYIHDVEDDDME
ncbi:6575_t:CDS:2, partial [Racocetra persica]